MARNTGICGFVYGWGPRLSVITPKSAAGSGRIVKIWYPSAQRVVIEALVVVFFAFVFHELAPQGCGTQYGFPAVYRVWIPRFDTGDGRRCSDAVCGAGGVGHPR